MKKALTEKQIEWAYKMWCLGYTLPQIADALYVHPATVWRMMGGRPKKRPKLVYTEEK